MKKARRKSPKDLDWHWSPGKSKPSPKPFQAAFNPPIYLSPEGHLFQVNWQPVPGAKKAVVEEGELKFMASVYNRSLGKVDHKSVQNGNAIEIDLKSEQVLRYLKFTELKHGEKTIRNVQDLNQAGLRLLCSAKLNGDWVPLYAVPSIGKRGGIPAMLGGASLNYGLFTLPGSVAARHWRLEVTTGSKIEDLAAQPIALHWVTATIRQAPVNPKVLGPEAQELWSQAGRWQGLDGAVSLRVPAEQALQKAIDEGAPALKVEYRLAAETHGQVLVSRNRIRGHLIRERKGVWQHQLKGEPVDMVFDPGLGQELPHAALADLTLAYMGIRLLDNPVPAGEKPPPGKVLGRILTEKTFTIPFPPKIFNPADGDLPPARIGLLGRAVHPCELVAKFVDRTTGRPIGDPASLTIETSPDFSVHWFEFPEKPFQATTPVLEISATRGRFYWVDGHRASLKIAVYDPNPGGEPVWLDDQLLANQAETKMHFQRRLLPVVPFRGNHPNLHSSLFLNVEISDLQLRYSR